MGCIEISTKAYSNLLNSLLLSLFFDLNTLNFNVIDSKRICSALPSLDHHSLLNDEVRALIPILSRIHCNWDSYIFFLHPKGVISFFKTLDLDIINTVSILRVLKEVSLANHVFHIVTVPIHLKQLKVSRLNGGMLERKLNLLFIHDVYGTRIR